MVDERYEEFKKRESLLDAQCSEFNTTEQLKCPFCGCKRPEMYWNYNDYDEWYVIECTDCGCRIKSEQSLEDCINQWNRRTGNEN